jgi:hypothetical protein
VDLPPKRRGKVKYGQWLLLIFRQRPRLLAAEQPEPTSTVCEKPWHCVLGLFVAWLAAPSPAGPTIGRMI